MAKYSKDRDINKLANQLVDEGWTPIRRTSHWQLIPPWGGRPLTITNTPSDGRAFLNFKADIRRISHDKQNSE